MTTLFSVVDASAQLPVRDESRQPAHDFAHELAKPDAQGRQPALPTQGQAKSMAAGSFDAGQSFAPAPPNAEPARNEALSPLAMQEPMLGQGQANESVPVVPTGVTETLLEARVFGWHAMAQAYLSELTAADAGVKPSGTWPSGRAGQETSAQAASDPQACNGAVAVVPAEQVAPTLAADALATPLSPTAEETTPAHALETSAPGSSAPALWPERSLRYTRQRDGSRVAWLRDFRLGDNEASALIGWVLNDARAKGMALGKIMLNGREVWTSPAII